MDGTHRHKHRQQRNKTPWRALNAEINSVKFTLYSKGHDLFTPRFFNCVKTMNCNMKRWANSCRPYPIRSKPVIETQTKCMCYHFFPNLDQERSTWIRSVVPVFLLGYFNCLLVTFQYDLLLYAWVQPMGYKLVLRRKYTSYTWYIVSTRPPSRTRPLIYSSPHMNISEVDLVSFGSGSLNNILTYMRR